jgi:predicted amidohydrolase YtcJ
MAHAVTAATFGAADSRFAEGWVASIAPGQRADYVVLETEWTPETLLDATAYQSWTRGRKVFEKLCCA